MEAESGCGIHGITGGGGRRESEEKEELGKIERNLGIRVFRLELRGETFGIESGRERE